MTHLTLRPLTALLSVLLLCLVANPAREIDAQEQRQGLLIIDENFVAVPVPVSVTDDRGRFVAGLKKEDFEVFEDGKLQEIASFSHDLAPLTTVLLIDTSGSMNASLPQVKTAAVRYVRALGAADRTKIMQFNERVSSLEEFTSDKQRLEGAITRLQIGGATALLNGLYAAIAELNAQRKISVGGKRAVVVLSDGDDTASALSDAVVIKAAQRSEAVIYCLRLQEERRDVERVEDLEGTKFLEDLATETGGRLLLTPIRRLDRVYEEVADELRNQYTLSYLSTNTTQDSKFRRLTVRIKGKRDVRIRHKPGYYAR